MADLVYSTGKRERKKRRDEKAEESQFYTPQTRDTEPGSVVQYNQIDAPVTFLLALVQVLTELRFFFAIRTPRLPQDVQFGPIFRN